MADDIPRLLRMIRDMQGRLERLATRERPNQALDITSSPTFAGLSITNSTPWTPGFAGTATPGVFTYTNRIGNYRLIDPLVFINARVSISAIGTPPVGNMTISGIPFASAGTYYAAFSFGLISNFNYALNAVELTMFTGVGLSRFDLYEAFDNAGAVACPAANFTNANCDLIFSGVYLKA